AANAPEDPRRKSRTLAWSSRSPMLRESFTEPKSYREPVENVNALQLQGRQERVNLISLQYVSPRLPTRRRRLLRPGLLARGRHLGGLRGDRGQALRQGRAADRRPLDHLREPCARRGRAVRAPGRGGRGAGRRRDPA